MALIPAKKPVLPPGMRRPSEPQPEPEVIAEPVAPPEPQPEPEVIAEPVAPPEPQPEPVAPPEPQPEPEVIAEPQPEPQPEPEVSIAPPAVKPVGEVSADALAKAAQALIPPTSPGVNPLDKPVEAIANNPQYFNEEHADRLVGALPAFLMRAASINESGDEELDVREMISELLLLARGLRRSVLTEQGALKHGKDVKDAKDVLSTTANLVSTLMKFRKDIDHQARQSAIERAVVETLEEVEEQTGVKLRELYLERLEKNLELVE